MIQKWFTEAKLGIFIHWGIYAVNGMGESWPIFRKEITPQEYLKQLAGFTAADYHPHEWAELFKRAGANYAVLTTKHHDGVALWPSNQNHYNVVKDTPAARDLVKAYCDALRHAGLRVGLYFSHLDWLHPDYATLPKRTPESDHVDATTVNEFSYRENNPAAWERFLSFHRAQLKELCTNYSPDLLWFDGDWDRTAQQWRMAQLRDQLHEWAPGVVLNSRMHGYGDYETPEQGLPVVAPSGPWEFCMTLNDSWPYRPSDTNYKSVRQLVRYFTECIGAGGNLLLNIGPRADGTIPCEARERLEGLGAWIALHREAIYATKAGLPAGHFLGTSTMSDDATVLYLFYYDKPVDTLAVKGIRNAIQRISVPGKNQDVSWNSTGGASWSNIPGVLWIDLPEQLVEENATVIKVELEGPLDLYRGSGGAIEEN